MFKIQINTYEGGVLVRYLTHENERVEEIINLNSIESFIGDRVLKETDSYNKSIFKPGDSFLLEINVITSTKFKEGEVFL